MKTIGAITIGQSPRDDIVPVLQRRLGSSVRFVQSGALDGVTSEQLQVLAAAEGEQGYQTRLADGTALPLLAHDRLLPRLQDALDRVVADGADVVVVLCAADWGDLVSDRLVVNAGPLCDDVVHRLATGRRLGILRPRPDAPEERTRRESAFAARDITTVTQVLNPYAAETSREDFAAAGAQFRDAGADVIWMGCMGMDTDARAAVQEQAQVAVLSAQGVVGAIVEELTTASVTSGPGVR